MYEVRKLDEGQTIALCSQKHGLHEAISVALSNLAVEQPGRAKAIAGSICWVFELAERAVESVALRFVESVEGCREVVNAFLTSAGASRSKLPDERWQVTSSHNHNRVFRALLAVGKLTAELIKLGLFDGRDPFRITPLGETRRTKVEHRHGRLRSDTDRYWRMNRSHSAAPRLNLPDVHSQVQLGLKDVLAPEVFHLICAMAVLTGMRAFQILGLTLYDILGPSTTKHRFHSANKGSKGHRSLQIFWPRALRELVLAWVGGERAVLSGRTLRSIQAQARSLRRCQQLKLTPLFTLDGATAIKYTQLYYIFRKAARSRNLILESGSPDPDVDLRFATFHLLRHEFVFKGLEAIERLPPDRVATAKRNLIMYMGWREGPAGQQMLDWYSRHFQMRSACTAAARLSQADQLEGLGAANDNVLDYSEIHLFLGLVA